MTSWLSFAFAGGKNQRWIALAYACCLLVLLLAPFHFKSPIVPNGAHRGAQFGISFTAPGVIRSLSPATRLAADLNRGSGLTLEVWVAASGFRLHGPARIVSYSLASQSRNFTLGQEALDLVMLLRTTRTNPSGYKPHVRIRDVFASTALQHIVVTYDFKRQRIYVNGRRRLDTPMPGGNFANWDLRHYLLLGNEATGSAAWLGKLSLVAIYNRVLSGREIARNFAAGPVTDSLKRQGAVALYEPGNHEGAQLADSSGAKPPLDLFKPHYLIQRSNAFLSWPQRIIPTVSTEQDDIIANIALFLPCGFLLYAGLLRSGYRKWIAAAMAVTLGAFVSLAFESAQYFLPGRTSSLLDVLMNASGTALGIALNALCARLALRRRLRVWRTYAHVWTGSRSSGITKRN